MSRSLMFILLAFVAVCGKSGNMEKLHEIWLPEVVPADSILISDIREAVHDDPVNGWYLVNLVNFYTVWIDKEKRISAYHGKPEDGEIYCTLLHIMYVPLPYLYDNLEYSGYFKLDDRLFVVLADPEHRFPLQQELFGTYKPDINLFFKSAEIMPIPLDEKFIRLNN